MHISLAAETIGHIGFFPISNSFLMALIVTGIWVTIALMPKNLKGRFYTVLEAIIEGMISVMEGVLGRGKVVKQIFPLVATFFLMVVTSNWLGLLPGVGSIGFTEEHVTKTAAHETITDNTAHAEPASTPPPTTALPVDIHEGVVTHTEEAGLVVEDHGTAPEEHHEAVFVPLFRPVHTDLNMTLAIAIISVFMTQVISIRNIHFKPYLKKFFNFSNPIMFFVGLLEIISEFVKVFSFSFRMFGNLFAGEVLLVVMFSLVPFVAPIPFLGIELFAGFIQALIFSMLTVVFINGAVQTHEAH